MANFKVGKKRKEKGKSSSDLADGKLVKVRRIMEWVVEEKQVILREQ